MPRHTPHAEIRGHNMSAAEAHRAHGRTPFVACPACQRLASLPPLPIRLGLPGSR